MSQPDKLSPAAEHEREVHRLQQVLAAIAPSPYVLATLRNLRKELKRMRPGGNWTDGEIEACKRAKDLAAKLAELLESQA